MSSGLLWSDSRCVIMIEIALDGASNDWPPGLEEGTMGRTATCILVVWFLAFTVACSPEDLEGLEGLGDGVVEITPTEPSWTGQPPTRRGDHRAGERQPHSRRLRRVRRAGVGSARRPGQAS